QPPRRHQTRPPSARRVRERRRRGTRSQSPRHHQIATLLHPAPARALYPGASSPKHRYSRIQARPGRFRPGALKPRVVLVVAPLTPGAISLGPARVVVGERVPQEPLDLGHRVRANPGQTEDEATPSAGELVPGVYTGATQAGRQCVVGDPGRLERLAGDRLIGIHPDSVACVRRRHSSGTSTSTMAGLPTASTPTT